MSRHSAAWSPGAGSAVRRTWYPMSKSFVGAHFCSGFVRKSGEVSARSHGDCTESSRRSSISPRRKSGGASGGGENGIKPPTCIIDSRDSSARRTAPPATNST